MKSFRTWLFGLAALACAIAGVDPADSAVTANSIITAQTPNRGVQSFVQGTDSAGTYKTVYTGGANGSKCFGLTETNNDGSATHLINVVVTVSAHKYFLVAVTTASNDGNANGVPAKNLISATNLPGLPLDGNGNPFFYLASGDTLQATFATALTASTEIDLVAQCVDF